MVTAVDLGLTSTEALVEELDELCVGLRTACAEAFYRATTDAEQALWRNRCARVRQIGELVDRDDVEALAAAIRVLRARRHQVREHIDRQIGAIFP